MKKTTLAILFLFIFPAVSFSKWVSPESGKQDNWYKIVQEESVKPHSHEKDVFSRKKPIVYDGKPDYWRMAQKHNEAIRNKRCNPYIFGPKSGCFSRGILLFKNDRWPVV